MKRNVLVFGTIFGLILTGWMNSMAWVCNSNPQFKSNDALGYAAMIAVFSLIFVGIKNYRDKYHAGVITFGKAFKTGLYISLIASTMYVGVWLIDYYIFIPGYLDQYIAHVLYNAKIDGATQEVLNQKAAEMANFKELYKNPAFVVLVTYAEVLPAGVIISLISALILKRKEKIV